MDEFDWIAVWAICYSLIAIGAGLTAWYLAGRSNDDDHTT